MATTTIVVDQPSKAVGEVANHKISCVKLLDDGELLTGTPTESSAAGITIANVAVNTVALVIKGKKVAIGKALMFRSSGGTAGTTYQVTFTLTTDSTLPQTRIVNVNIPVIANTA